MGTLWKGTVLASLPGRPCTYAIIGLLVLWVSWRVFRCPDRERLTLPYFLWLIAAGTFVPPVSNDYNLAPLPLAFLSTFSTRDPLSLIASVLLLPWCQPLRLPLSARLLLFMKLGTLIAVGAMLARRAVREERNRGSA